MSEIDESLKKYGFERPFKADKLAKIALEYLNVGYNLLDVGCGEGADAVFFANHGLKVEAVDKNNLHLDRLRALLKDFPFLNISIQNFDVVNHQYAIDKYDIINCLLVGCCMRRSEFEKMLTSLKRTLKSGGIMIMSLRNYLDPEFHEFAATQKMIESNTYLKKDSCCEIRYFIEKGRLKEVFEEFEILYYSEGLEADKYQEIEEHGDSYIIARKPG